MPSNKESNKIVSDSNWKELLRTGKILLEPKSKASQRKVVIDSSTTKKRSYAETVELSNPSKQLKLDVDGDSSDEDLLDTIDKIKSQCGNSDISTALTSLKGVPLTTVDEWFAHLDKGSPHCDKTKLGKYVALDCEMVGVGESGEESALARISIINFHGHTLLDQYVRPLDLITDYRTEVSGITYQHIKNAQPLCEVQPKIVEILNDRVLVGHSLHHDFKVMLLEHPRKMIRDTSLFHPFRQHSKSSTPSLRKLAELELGLQVQTGVHNSVEDAKVAMILYRIYQKTWESNVHKYTVVEGLAKKTKSKKFWANRKQKAKERKNMRRTSGTDSRHVGGAMKEEKH